MEWTWGDAAGIGSMQPEAPKAGIGSMLDRWDSWMQAVFGDTIVERQRQAIEAMKRGDRETAERLTTGLATDFGGFLGSIKPIRAFHGSPHDFDKFSMDKIGTGEGAQAYGHGLYFAENEGVARNYRNTLSGAYYKNADGALTARGPAFEEMLSHVRAADPGLHPQQAATIAGSVLDGIDSAGSVKKFLSEYDLPVGPNGKFKAGYEAAARYAKEHDLRHTPGRMYEVAIHADPERFLDWDRPLGRQPQIVDALRDTATSAALERAGYAAGIDGVGPARTGGDLLDRLAVATRATPSSGMNRAGASTALRDAGIPGIKYLDAGSRSASDGTRNYVVFDDSIIEILRKYGLIGPAAGLGALAYPEDEGL